MKRSLAKCDVNCINPKKTNQLRDRLPQPQELALLAQTLSNMGDVRRLGILLLLSARRELCVCDIASVLDITVALASHHLRKLRDAGLLQHRQDGKLVYYSLSPSQETKTLLSCARRLLPSRSLSDHSLDVCGGAEAREAVT